MRKVTFGLLVAVLCSGCAEAAIGIPMARYNPNDSHKGRILDYSECSWKDNASWEILDACMVGKGYTLKK